jgi:catechol-2,3-dioxygenase
VSRARFAEIQDRARAEGIAFEGPVTHPENGPLGESIYFTDPGGNFMEVCWRRDEDAIYNPMMVGEQ